MLKRLDPAVRGIVWMALLVLVENIQLVIIAGFVSSLVPVKIDPFNYDIFPVYQGSIKSTRQMTIYHLFILAGLLGQAAAVYAFRRKLEDRKFQDDLKQLLCADALWVFIQCFAIFKILIYNSPAWGWGLFYASLAGSMLSRIFWPEIKRWLGGMEFTLRTPTGLSWWGPLLAVVEAAQVTIGLNWLLERSHAVQPVFLFGVFILSAFLISRWMAFKKVRAGQLKPFIIAESLLTFFLLSALFKMMVYDFRHDLALRAYHVLLVLAVLNKIFWPRLWRGLQAVWAALLRNASAAKIGGDILFAAFIILTIYIPDPQAVLAKMFIGDEFIHTDCFIMAPGWAWISGCLLDVDVMSRYGLGIPIVIGSLAKALDGYSYLSVFLVIMWICIIYYLLCYLFLRLWLKSFALAAAAVLVGIKTQMFYTLSFPQPLTYTSATPARFMLDIVFMLCIWGHLQTRHWGYLLSAALCCGASFFCIPETGLYLAVAFYAYLLLQFMITPKTGGMAAFWAFMAPASACVLLWSYLGGHLLKKEFWDNLTEISKLYTAGFWMGPFSGGLQYGQFWDLLIGMSFPLVYMATILIIGTLCVLRRLPQEHLMAVVLSFYGLGAHHYYVVMATANNYYPRGLPFVFVVFYWISRSFAALDQEARRRAGAALLAFCAYALWTNHHYLSYPNIFNFSRDPMVDPLVAERLPDGKYYFNHRYVNYSEDLKLPVNSLGDKNEDLKTDPDFRSDEELKAYYKKETDFSEDVRLIRSFVPPGQPVPLLSSYETEMLMQAKRKPFFYYFRLLPSRPLRMRSFGSSDIWTTKELKKLTDQMDDLRPPYIFMERVFLQDPTPAQRAAYDPAIMGLVDHVKGYYQPYAYGKYLVAMKRIGGG